VYILQQTIVVPSHWENRSRHAVQQSDCELDLTAGSTINEAAKTAAARNR